MRVELWDGFTKGIGGLFKGSGELFSAGGDITYAIAMVGTELGAAVLTAFLLPAVVVRQAAISSRDRVIGKGPLKVSQKLDNMVVWPLRYPKPLQLLLFIALLSACFVFYRLTLALVGVVIAMGVKEFLKTIKS